MNNNTLQMNKLITIIVLLSFSISSFAQRGGKMQERIKAQKIAFITNQLNLSANEAQKFWPIYNTFENKMEDIRKNDLKDVRLAMRKGDLTDSEAQTILDKFMAAEDKLHNAKRQLVTDLNKAIPPQKIIALKKAEEDFRKKLLEIMQQRKKRQQNRKN